MDSELTREGSYCLRSYENVRAPCRMEACSPSGGPKKSSSLRASSVSLLWRLGRSCGPSTLWQLGERWATAGPCGVAPWECSLFGVVGSRCCSRLPARSSCAAGDAPPSRTPGDGAPEPLLPLLHSLPALLATLASSQRLAAQHVAVLLLHCCRLVRPHCESHSCWWLCLAQMLLVY